MSTAIPGRLGLIGAGAFGRFCLDAYRRTSDLQVVAAADPAPDALALVHATAPEVQCEREWTALVDDPSIEVVHVATPPFLRGEVVRAAFAAGKSVFCEKPLATTLEEADDLIAAADHSGVRLGVNYVMRHHAAYALAEQLAASGLFGGLRTISFINYAQQVPAGHWFWDRARSGGILVEHGVHFFDAYARLAGDAVEVSGSEPKREAAEATVRYVSGVLGRYYHEFDFPNQVEYTAGVSGFERGIVGIDGWIPTRVWGYVLATAEQVHESLGRAGSNRRVEGGRSTSFSVDFQDRQEAYAAAIVAGMRDVVRCHRDRTRQLLVLPAEARASLAVALAAGRAAHEGRSVRP